MTLPDLKAIFGVEDEAVADAMEILRPWTQLIPIMVEGHEIRLPDNNSLWRGMQFWGLMTGEIRIDFGLFCIAGTCKNCKSRILRPGEERPLGMLACQTTIAPNLSITRLPQGFTFRPSADRQRFLK